MKAFRNIVISILLGLGLAASTKADLVVSNSSASVTSTSVTFNVTLVSTNAGLPANVYIQYGPNDGMDNLAQWANTINLGTAMTGGSSTSITVYGFVAGTPILTRSRAVDASNTVWTALLSTRTSTASRTDVNPNALTVTNAYNQTASAVTAVGALTLWTKSITYLDASTNSQTATIVTNVTQAAATTGTFVTNGVGSTSSVLKDNGR